MCVLFDDTNGEMVGPSPYSIPRIEYLRDSCRTEEKNVRECIENWFSRYPSAHKAELKSRFFSDHFDAAFLELYIHELFLCLDYSLEVHPELRGAKDTKPDFKISEDKDSHSFLEVTMVRDESKTESAATSRENIVYDSINNLDSPNFFLLLDLKGSPATPPSGKRLKKQLSSWLSKLDISEVTQLYASGGLSALPSFDYFHDGWEIRFSALPKNPDKRGSSGIRPIGAMFHGVRYLNTWESVRDAIKAKGSHYGDLSKPLIIALNVQCIHFGIEDMMQALFGQEQYVISTNRDMNESAEMRRAQNGAWYGPKGPQFRRISAVILACNISPWNISQKEVRLFHNPWATHPISGSICTLPQGVPVDDKIELVDGIHPRDIFGLSPNWPEE